MIVLYTVTHCKYGGDQFPPSAPLSHWMVWGRQQCRVFLIPACTQREAQEDG